MTEQGYEGAYFFLFICGSLAALIFFFYIRNHPIVNVAKLKRRIEQSHEEKNRMNSADNLLTDINLNLMIKNNLRSKGITITWTDSYTGEKKDLNFFVDGTSKTTQCLRTLAKQIKKDSFAKLMKTVYRMPKRHGRDEVSNVVMIHNVD